MQLIELPLTIRLKTRRLLDWDNLVPEYALELFTPYMPADSHLSIERSCGNYLIRLRYISKKTGRSIFITAKGQRLPVSAEDELLKWYLKQLILTPSEIAREFSRIYFLERRARQDAFLNSSYEDGRRIKVSENSDDSTISETYGKY